MSLRSSQCDTDAGVGTGHAIYVEVGGQASEPFPANLSYAGPAIYYFEPQVSE